MLSLRSSTASIILSRYPHIISPLLCTFIPCPPTFARTSNFPTIAHVLFDEYPQRTVNFWNSTGCISNLAFHQSFVERQLSNDLISWTATISRLAASNRQEEAIGTFKSMLLEGLRPNHVTVLSVINAFGGLDCRQAAWVIHGFLIKLGFESELLIATALLGLYSIHNMTIVWQLFDQLSTKDVVLWSSMVVACWKNGQFIEAINSFREMQFSGVVPNHVSIVSILPVCADLGVVTLGRQIHGCSIKRDFSSVINVQNSLVDMYAKCRDMKSAILVFEEIEKKDLISWNIMICGCMENGHPREALNVFLTMQYDTYCRPDAYTLRNALAACPKAKETSFGLGLHCFIVKFGLLASISVGTALLRMYADFGDVITAKILFDLLQQKDLIAFSAMISVYAKAGYPDLALNTFKQMQMDKMKPNAITLVSLVQACSTLDTLKHGKNVHAHVVRVGYFTNAFITAALIDLYCKFGKLGQAKLLFDKLQRKDLICWSSMINGYGMNGCGVEALETFFDMVACGIKANEVVFISILSACSHCGMESEGWWCFHNMESIFGVTPTLEHYACMVDMLSRQGKIEEALDFINKMPMKPDTSVWGALLFGCKANQGAVEVAELAANKLLELDPGNTSYYIILSNLYAEIGQWKEVERIRMHVKEKGFRKTLGYSMIET